MSGEDSDPATTDFELRTRALLLAGSEALPASVRSRLTQARYAALAAAAGSPSPRQALIRRWVPAGAVAGVVLALFVVLTPHGSGTAVRVAMSGAQFEDMDLLTDSDAATLLSGDQEVDDDFYEWAANEAGGPSAIVGS